MLKLTKCGVLMFNNQIVRQGDIVNDVPESLKEYFEDVSTPIETVDLTGNNPEVIAGNPVSKEIQTKKVKGKK